MQIGDTVNLVRKITGELLPVELTEVLVRSPTPAVEVRWPVGAASNRYTYKLDLVKGEVLAIDATLNHRQTMRIWYRINETDKAALTELFWSKRKLRRK